jgi:serine/threonine-protein kinase
MEELQAATLGEYEIMAELGRGGMATVFLAHDIQLDRKVAIKVLNQQLLEGPGTAEMVDRFKLEARTAAALSHPGIIPIYAVRDNRPLLWFVMKFVPGRPLDSIIEETAPLPVPMVRSILGSVAEALAYAHRQGVVHRDVKPANIMIDSDGHPVIMDFGVARVSQGQGLTMSGAAVGTPHYMSPEQCQALAATGASDQYALGIVGYEMLTGRHLYEGDSAVTIMYRQAYHPVPDQAAFGSQTPPELADVIIRMLQKEPGDRWPNLEDVIPLLRGATAVEEARVRTSMASLAATGPQRAILARVSTPRSPTPLTTRGVPAGTPRSSGGVAGAHAATPAPAADPPASAPTARRTIPSWALLVAVVLALGAGGLLWSRFQSEPFQAPVVESTPPATGVAADSPSATLPPRGPGEPETPPPPAAEPPLARGTTAEAATVAGIQFVSAPVTLVEGDSALLRVEVRDGQGQVLRRPVTFRSQNPQLAVVRGNGIVVALGPGRVAVTAGSGGRTARTELEIIPLIASVTVSPAAETLALSRSTTLTAIARRRDGAEVSGAAITWRSSDEGVAVVSSNGRVTALTPGTTTITAAASGRRGSALITVAAPAVAPPPPVAPPPAAPQPPPEDAQTAVRDLVAAYARALESKDMVRVRALYPGMSAATERQTRDAMAEMNELVVRLAPSSITIDGTRAQARVSGEWTWRGGRPLQVNNLYRFERRAGGWVIVVIE